MADTKTTALTEITAPVSTDLVYVVGDPGTTPVSRKATLSTIRKTLMVDGWIEAGETWTYAAADAPTYTFTISGDKTTKYGIGMRLKLTDVTVKYFIVTAVTYGAPNTTVTVYGGTDYTLTGGAITLPYYSMAKAPFGFPLSPLKWRQEYTDTTDRSQATPTINVWYNLNTASLSIPIGIWDVSYFVSVTAVDASATIWPIGATLSTANNSSSDADWNSFGYASDVTANGHTFYRSKTIALAAKTTYYLNTRTTASNLDTLYNSNSGAPLIIRAVCAYL